MRQIIHQQKDGLDLLRDIVELAKNPKLVVEAHEQARREFALTEEERSRTESARTDIKKAEAILVDIDAKRTAINSARDQNEKMASELETKESKLKAKEEDLVVKISKNDALEKKLLSLQDELNSKESSMASQGAFLEMEKVRLSEFDNELRTRLKKVQMRESAADL